MEELYPEQKECILPSINLPIYVPVHSVASLFTLLMASDLMKAQNLLFADIANPCYVPPRNMNTPLGEINTGNAYYDYFEHKKLTENDVIVPLMLFADGMQIDKNGRICQEPWMYTLGIFKRHIRNQPRAWRNIGLTKLNAHNMYSNEEIRQSQKICGMDGKSHNQGKICTYQIHYWIGIVRSLQSLTCYYRSSYFYLE